jgi:hypothetical protein
LLDEKSAVYNLELKQPIDHTHPEKGVFIQHIQLRHKGFDHPSVIETQGYWMDTDRNEIEQVFDANNLNVEYRFYGKSVPDTIPWTYLTLEQATADLHRINTLFRKIYSGKWISTGASKGGQTTLFYKYFYPDDVDLAIPYVAPVNVSLEDTRIYDFLDTIGSVECRNKIKSLQFFLLKHEEEIVRKLDHENQFKDSKFKYLGGNEKAFELQVLEFPFAFWQEGYSCSAIPDTNNVDSCYRYVQFIIPLGFWSDEGIKMFSQHYYQCATQTGYYKYNIAAFKNLLHNFKENPTACFPPKNVAIKFTDCKISKELLKWLDAEGNNICYIYGGNDTWSACRVTPSQKVNSKCFIVPGQSHSAGINTMTPEMKNEFRFFVKSTTGLTVKF